MSDGLSSDQPILITVEARAQGWRVDHYLSRLFPNFSRALFQRAIEQQTILVNGIPVKTSRRLRMNDRLSVRLPELPDFATIDVSFISLKLVLPGIGKLLRARASLVALIKPQFEIGRRDIKKGIVRDPAVHHRVCNEIAAFLAVQGWNVGGVVPSPILGGDGNREFFIEAERG